jgi:peptidyl-tRNA hydrolase
MAMKQAIIVDKSLKLPRGKLAAQVAHAAVAAFLEAGQEARQQWLDEGMPKVVLKVDSQAALMTLQELAQQQKIPAQLIADAGRTVVSGGTITCLGLGPTNEENLDQLTGDLKLL